MSEWDELDCDRDDEQCIEFTETPQGREALDKWVRWQDECNGAPCDPWDY